MHTIISCSNLPKTFFVAMVLLMKLSERLSKLSKSKVPKRLQKGAFACKSECDAVLQKANIEKRDLEAALESRDADNDKLKVEVEFYRSLMRVRGMLLYYIHACTLMDVCACAPFCSWSMQ